MKYDKVRLLTPYEWEIYASHIPGVPISEDIGGWWTNSRGGLIKEDGVWKGFDDNHSRHVVAGVRPLFKMGGFSVAGYRPGDKVKVGNIDCTVVNTYKTSAVKGGRRTIPVVEALADKMVRMLEYDEIQDFFFSDEFREIVYS